MQTPPPDHETAPEAPRPAPGRGSGALAMGLAGSILLAGFACRELLHFAPHTRLSVSMAADVDAFFFEPSDSSPGIVLLLCGWLLWRRRRRLAALWGIRGRPAVTAGLWAAALGIFTWSVRSGAPELQAVALVPALLGAAHLLGGLAAVRVVALPAATLLFAVPVPPPLMNEILWTLQIWTAHFTGFLVGRMGFAVFVSGDQIIMHEAVFQIIETCSGAKAIETLGMLSILMIDLFERRGWHAVALVVASLPVAFLINGLRCVGLIFNPHADIASIHSLQGIAMLLVGVLLLYLLDGLLERCLSPRPRLSALERRARAGRTARGPLQGRVALMVGVAASFAALSLLPERPTQRGAVLRSAAILPEEAAGWRGEDLERNYLFLGTAAFHNPILREYSRGGRRVEIFLGPANPRYRHRSYLSPKVGFPGTGWRIEHEERAELAGRPVELRVMRRGPSRRLVAHWFEASPGLWSEVGRSLLALDGTGAVRAPRPVAVRLSTPITSLRASERESARTLLEAFYLEVADPVMPELVGPEGQLEVRGKKRSSHLSRTGNPLQRAGLRSKRITSMIPVGSVVLAEEARPLQLSLRHRMRGDHTCT